MAEITTNTDDDKPYTLTPSADQPRTIVSGDDKPYTLTPSADQPRVSVSGDDKPYTLTPSADVRQTELRALPVLSLEGSTQYKEALAVEKLQDLIKEYGRPLSKDDFMEDDRLMELVDLNLETRYRSGNFGVAGTGYSYLSSAAGAATGRNWQDKTKEDRFETWQNYHRSFAGGQTVTTANEVGFLVNADDDTRAGLGMGYTLFDSMGNIFGKDTSWGEMFDGVGDYVKAAVWDPTTVASLGVGKLLSAGATKATAEGLRALAIQAAREAVQNGASRTAAEAASRAAVQQALKESSRFSVREAAGAVARNTVVDVVANVGADIAYQNVLIATDAQEEFSYLQTGIAALGSVAIPGLMIGSKIGSTGLRSAGVRGYGGMAESLAVMDEGFINAALKASVSDTKVIGPLVESFRRFSAEAPTTPEWRQAADAAKDAVGEVEVSDVNQKFWQTFLFGDDKSGFIGIAQAMRDAGVEWVPRNSSDKVTRFLSDSIEWLGDDAVESIVKNYESAIGRELNLASVEGVDKYTSNGLADIFRSRQSWIGAALQQSSLAKTYVTGGDVGGLGSRLGSKAAEKTDLTVGRLVRGFVDDVNNIGKVEDAPERGRWALSVWKRLLTSHPATTGANVKGWGMMYGLNTVTDMVHGVISLASSLDPTALTRGGSSAAEARRRGAGSILGALRRGANLIDPSDTIQGAERYLALKPELAERVFTTVSGDSGFENAVKTFNMNPDSLLVKGTETTVRGIQNITGVLLQDEVTKHISFMSALDTAVRREYGQSFNDFIDTRTSSEAYLEMFSTRWREGVDAWALDRTVRETASKSWSSKSSGSNIMREMATAVEAISNNAVGGYAVPFGRFFNTATALLGDVTGANFGRHLVKRATGREINLAEEEGQALLARAVVGWTGFYLYSEKSMSNLEEGLTWSQERRPDGSIQDKTYEWPESIFRIIGQVIAHKRRDGEAPKELKVEAFAILGAQTFRTLDTAGKDIYNIGEAIISLDPSEAGSLLMEQAGNLVSQIVSGATRPLDPVNQAAMLMRGDTTTPDRRQGYKFINNSFRYVDHIFGNMTEDQPRRYYPTRNEPATTDAGKMLGSRTSQEPLPVEKMMAAVGRPNWTVARWSGPPEVKNRMDQLIGPVLNTEAAIALVKNPDFFEMSLNQRQAILDDVISTSKKTTTRLLESSTQSSDQNLELVRDLTKLDQKDLGRAKEFLGIEGDPIDIIGEPNGIELLKTLEYFAKNWDRLEPRYWENK